MEKFRILLTNDDGPKSGLLHCLAETLSRDNEVYLSIPDTQQSGVSQALTCFRSVQAKQIQIANCRGIQIDARPADAVGIALGHTFRNPDFCVSGINIGTNAGTAFFYNSGTVGAARQAALHRVPAIAISVFVPDRIYHAVHEDPDASNARYAQDWQRIAGVASRVCLALIGLSKTQSPHTDYFNVNLPWDIEHAERFALTRLSQTQYAGIYSQEQDLSFKLTLSPSNLLSENEEVSAAQAVESDFAALARGHIAITPCKLQQEGYTPEELEAFKQQLAQLL